MDYSDVYVFELANYLTVRPPIKHHVSRNQTVQKRKKENSEEAVAKLT
jgi:hypothetical protein